MAASLAAADGLVVVVTARASEPPGIVLAWDLTRTTYRRAVAPAAQVARAVVRRERSADPVLRRERPDLYRGLVLTGCRADDG